MSTVVTADDLELGNYVTPHQPQVSRVEKGLLTNCGAQTASGKEIRPGIPLRVIAIDLPFVACAQLQPDGSEKGPLILDIRSLRLCRLSAEFVEAITRFRADG